MRTLTLGLAVAFALVAGAASAHPRLVSASPAPGGQVAGSPRQIRIKFNEAVFPKFSGVTIKSQAGAAVKTGKAGVDPRDRTQLVVPVTTRLAPGRYRLIWRAVASDTHRVQGQYDFTVK
ncbi:MAG TPA: copper homeostasis periplasmic binding protein CopC [Caulobacteraceae bacterium]|nr:copper homeostasis periplasmic binding protein CopC [Caulobacteraceae bacterium]